MFPDVTIQKYSENSIVENLYSQVSEEGSMYTLIEEIVYHIKDKTEEAKEEVNTKRSNFRCRRNLTSKGWRFLVTWKYVRKYCITSQDIKQSYSIKVAEYKKSKNIEDKTYFIWWVPYTPRKQDIVIMGVSSIVKKKTHKYGIEMPNNVLDAYGLDRFNWDNCWSKSTTK